METDLNRIKRIAEMREGANWEFRSFLKNCDIPLERIDFLVHKLYQRVSSKIDCKTCANCCKETQICLDQEDVNKLSNGIGISEDNFKDRYLEEPEKPDEFRLNKRPCLFLRGNLCLYYEYRPKACVSYPHLHKKEFTSRLLGVLDNYFICPIVFNVFEYLKDEIRDICNFQDMDD